MKKVILGFLVALSLFVMPGVKADEDLPVITDHEKVTVYLFRSSSCGHCHDFLEYFAQNYYKYQDYFEIVSFEVSDGENYELMSAVKERMGADVDGRIPYIVIGNSFDQLGFDTDGQEIIDEALAAYQDESYQDYVGSIIEEEGYEPSDETLEEAAESLGINVVGLNGEDPEAGLSDGAIVAIIFGILILGFGGLVLYSRKK
ncbi:MAG TPA: LPXTG cell wall anchor domain-containing protein [Candidatus Onthocola stercoravium]|nr:LPXTG cell wall anchor domain-containing protein [Candidatus Onthocola stercoravium]